MRTFLTAGLILLLSSSPLLAEPSASAADPAINTPYTNPNFDRWRATFEQHGREVYDQREAILSALHLTPGLVVADIGAGTGLFSRLMAREVGSEGRVYAVDIAPSFVAGIERTAREEGLENVVGVVNDQASIGLPADSVDRIFIADTYHHFEQPQAMLAAMWKALHSGGELVIVDFRRTPGVSSDWILAHVRAGEEVVRGEVEAAGFQFVESPGLLQGNYFLRFRKP